MKKIKFSVINVDSRLVEILANTEHKILAIWASDCANRVIKIFEEKYPEDNRPSYAIKACIDWVNGKIKIADARKFAFSAHKAARESLVKSACEAVRSAGHAAATTHVKNHAVYAANYALSSIYYANILNENKEVLIEKEKNWQYKHLIELKKQVKKYILEGVI